MKKIYVVLLVVALLAVTVVPAFAAGGPSANRGSANPAGSGIGSQARYAAQAGFGIRTPYALSGTIVALDSQAKTVTVAVSCGNRLLDPYLTADVTLQTNAATRFLQRNDDGTVTPITFADLVIGETVSSHGSLVDGIFTASRVTQGALLACIQ